MTRVLIVGDSTSIGYEPAVRRELAPLAHVERNPDNGGDSSNVLAHIGEWLATARPDIVTLNCGLHDIKRNRQTGEYQVPLDLYRRNLPAIADKVRGAGSRLVWITTTPVIQERHRVSRDFDRFNADIDAYNAALLALATRRAEPVVLLHETAPRLGLDGALLSDGVHFTPRAYDELGRTIAVALRHLIESA